MAMGLVLLVQLRQKKKKITKQAKRAPAVLSPFEENNALSQPFFVMFPFSVFILSVRHGCFHLKNHGVFAVVFGTSASTH